MIRYFLRQYDRHEGDRGNLAAGTALAATLTATVATLAAATVSTAGTRSTTAVVAAATCAAIATRTTITTTVAALTTWATVVPTATFATGGVGRLLVRREVGLAEHFTAHHPHLDADFAIHGLSF